MNPRDKSMKSFLMLWSGQAISLFGSQLVQFALIWWLTQETGSATVLAMASLVGLLPQVVLGPFVGVLVDRWNRRVVMLAADGMVALATLVLALLFWAGSVQIWQVFVILFVRALAGAFHWPAMQASVVLMVPEKHLTRVQGLNQMMQGALNIVSAPVGALLLAVLPVQGILAIDVITAVIAITILFFIHVPQPEHQRTQSAQSLREFSHEFRQDLQAGLRYVWSWPALMMIMVMAMFINLLLNPAFSLLPLLVTGHFKGDALQLGFLEAMFGLGLVVGGLLLGVWGGFKRKIVTSMCGLIGMGLASLVIGFTPPTMFYVAVLGAFVIGYMNSFVNGPLFAILQAVVAPEMQGRVFTLIGSLAGLMSPIGLIIAGPVADVFGVQSWFVVGGAATLLMGVVGFFVPTIMNVESDREHQLAAEFEGNETTFAQETAVADATM
ncbi:MAG: MFS transporter [Anaerolineae bacterium]|nr:MFS transporter [Anaerolineae bacterium]